MVTIPETREEEYVKQEEVWQNQEKFFEVRQVWSLTIQVDIHATVYFL